MSFVQLLADKYEITINNSIIIQQAFHHTSYINENRKLKLKSNERLEFLGDAVLEVVVSDFLYHQYPEIAEGKLSLMRAQLVREQTLARLARELSFADYLLLGKGEINNGGYERDSILSDAMEAVIGAIYLDQGMEAVWKLLNDILLTRHEELLHEGNQDYKTQLQEILQEAGSVHIEYRLINQTGPAHLREFEMGLFVNNVLYATGKGKSKLKAEMAAAKAAIKKIK